MLLCYITSFTWGLPTKSEKSLSSPRTSRGTVVDEVVVLGNGVVGSSSGVYRRIKGGTVNIKQT